MQDEDKERLWEDMQILSKKHSEFMDMRHFASGVIYVITQQLLFCAPNEEAAHIVLENAIKQATDHYLEYKKQGTL